jgi:wyosine [tRNA(Phe)-imidazoG37] synthetase (radical SAM superfamily)
MLDQLQGFHIETTNMCTLKCLRCARTTFIEKFKPKNWDNQNLNLDHLKTFLDIDISALTFTLNGNYGDPIYYPDLFDLITYIKSNQGKIILHTNGSYQKIDWWIQLAGLLDEHDIVNFSIDGVPDNFTQYRINADWSSIKQGIDVLVKSSAKIIWKYIVFSYNEKNIEQAKLLSQQLGMDEFVLNNSDRWEDNDWLKPEKYVNIIDESGNNFLSNSSYIGGKDSAIIQWKDNNLRNQNIDPLCKKINSMHYISAWGYYMPCCWVGDYRFYYKSEFYKNRDLYDISKTTASKLLQNLQNYYDTLEQIKPEYCTFNCPKL